MYLYIDSSSVILKWFQSIKCLQNIESWGVAEREEFRIGLLHHTSLWASQLQVHLVHNLNIIITILQ